MRRALAILKYVPAVLCGLLVAAWVVSLFVAVGALVPLPYRSSYPTASLVIDGGSVILSRTVQPHYGSWVGWRWRLNRVGTPSIGSLSWFSYPSKTVVGFKFPIPLLITFCFPIALIATVRFRFPLWSYFVWTALIAAELAYYLR